MELVTFWTLLDTDADTDDTDADADDTVENVEIVDSETVVELLEFDVVVMAIEDGSTVTFSA
jgi:hypothetical protein